jgi:GNAT superfamily N-acetyltransferase
MPTIRPATPEDADRCGEIAVLAWRPVYDGWREMMGDDLWALHCTGWEDRKRGDVAGFIRQYPHWAIVTEVEGEIAGFLTFTLNEDKRIGEIGNNAVDPAYQGHGIGTAQCEWVLEHFRSHGMASAMVYTGLDEGHAPARTMYVKAGFDVSLPHIRYYKKL